MTGVRNKVRRVAVVGAGASGLVAAKYLQEEKYFETVDIFEQRDKVGGVWNYSSIAEKAQLPLDIPQENPDPPLEHPIWRTLNSSNSQDSREATFVSPLYDELETNIPYTLMQFSDFSFPEDTPLFPNFDTVAAYLDRYGQDVKHLIQYHTQVTDIQLHDENAGSWQLTRKDLVNGNVRKDIYDAVVVANGHYNVPSVPSFEGISAWNEAYPGVILHSKFYTSHEEYRNKKVIIVGNSASGIDIGFQISKVCHQPLIVSSRSESYFAAMGIYNRQECPPIAEFMDPKTHNRAIRFQDGQIEDNVDAVLFCTGYLYSFPFLSKLPSPVVTDGSRAHHVYQQLFYIEQPTLVFPALTQKVIPFPTAEAQSAFFARVWSGRISLPSKAEMYAWEESTKAIRGDGKGFHVTPFPADADYINYMHDWAASATPRAGLAKDGKGKECPYWGEKEKWLRKRFPQVRKAFMEQGEDRYNFRQPEDLDFDFEAWKREQLEGEASS